MNEIKISLERQQRMHKAFEIARQKPQTLIMGSSRPMVGIDPDYLKNLGYPSVFNGAFSGASMEELYYYFEHARHFQPNLKLIILGLDLFAFGKNRTPQPDFSLAHLKDGTFGIDRKITSLLSKTALLSTYETVTRNRREELLPIFLQHGQYNPENVMPIPKDKAEDKDLEYIGIMFSARSDYFQFELDPKKIVFFKRLIQCCKEEGIEIKVFFCPSKAIYWEAVYQTQLWPDFEKLKKELCALHPLWDFSGFNCITTEKFEILNLDGPLYFDCSHFRPVVGELILDRLFEKQREYGDFGFYLVPDTIEQVLAQIRADRANWVATDPPLIRRLKEFVLISVNHDPH